jgi:hypothetical protein
MKNRPNPGPSVSCHDCTPNSSGWAACIRLVSFSLPFHLSLATAELTQQCFTGCKQSESAHLAWSRAAERDTVQGQRCCERLEARLAEQRHTRERTVLHSSLTPRRN